MKIFNILTPKGKILVGALFFTLLQGCDDLLKVDEPASLITRETVFKDDATASTAVTGIYATMIGNSQSFTSGSNYSVSALAGLSSDELANYRQTNIDPDQIYKNQIHPENAFIGAVWKSSYQLIYQANAAIESLESSPGLSMSVKSQLLGECLFVRAFCHFYLINLFGDVPLITSTNYEIATNQPRMAVKEVYKQVITDLLQAQGLISDGYPTAERVRPNKSTVTALLARVYLYIGEWSNAEIQSSLIINNSNYTLEDDLNNVFLKTSREAIWQLQPTSRTINTWEGSYFILTGLPQNSYLTKKFIDSFEAVDARFDKWVSKVTSSGTTFYFAFKYKIKSGGPGSTVSVPLNEYSMVFRLAEQFLIRAEARAQLNKFSVSIADLNMIRERAKLPLISDTDTAIDKVDLLLAIEKDRRSELFTEWGHRWFDLKRTNRATTVLSPLKIQWDQTDELYPVPAIEFRNNPNLGEQNHGY